MHHAHTIALAQDLLAHGRAEDVLRMVEPLLTPYDEAEDEAAQAWLRSLAANACLAAWDDVDRALAFLHPFESADTRCALPERAHAMVALWLGWARARRPAPPHDEVESLSLLDEAYEGFTAERDARGRCWVQIGRAQAYFAIDEYHLMRQALEAAAERQQRLGDVFAGRWIHDLQVPALRFEGRYDAARTHADALYEWGQSYDNRLARGRAQAHRAALRLDLGRPPSDVLDSAASAITLLQSVDGGADYPLLAAYHARISALLRQGDWADAEDEIQDAFDVLQDHPVGAAHLQSLRARLALRRGNDEAAADAMADLFDQVHHLPHGLHRSHVTLLRGEILAHRGNYDEALHWMERAYRDARETGHRGHQCHTLHVLAETALRRGDLDAAERYLQRTADYRSYFGVLPFAARRFVVLSRQAQATDPPEEVRTLLEQALAAYSLMGDTYRTAEVQMALARVELQLDRPVVAQPLLSGAAATLDDLGRDEAARQARTFLERAQDAEHAQEQPDAQDQSDATAPPVAPAGDSGTVGAADSSSGAAIDGAFERSLGPALARAAQSVDLVADAWVRAVRTLLPDRWVGVFRRSAADASGAPDWTCLSERGDRPEVLAYPNDASGTAPRAFAGSSSPKSSSPKGDGAVADASAEPSSVAWQPLHPDAAIYMGVAAPDDAARWAAVRRRLTSWYAVARLAFAQALSDTPPAPSSAAASPAATAPSGPQVVAESSAMAAVDQRIRGIRSSHSPVLIQGERGAGKSFVARAVHAASERSGGPFLTLDCSSMQQDPLERRLFGRSEGATASPSSAAAADPADEPGALRRGRDGTLVLEAVDALPRQLQARLRHVLATGTFFPLGAEEPATTTARVVATSSRNLRDAVHAGDFDAQLYHHLNVIALRVPPLRERTDDIPLLVRRFLDDLCPGGAPMASITHDALEALLRYPWPGNVRQLRNEIEQALSAVRSEPAPTIGLDELSEAVRATVHTEPAAASPSSGPGGDGSVAEASASDAPAIHQSDQTLRSILADTERSVIEQALAACDGQVTASADMLGLSRQGLYKKMDRLGIDATAFQPHASPS